MKFLIFLVLMAAGVLAENPLKGSRVYDVYPLTSEQYNVLSRIEYLLPNVDVWQRPNPLGREGRIMVPENAIAMFEDFLIKHEIGFTIFMQNLERVFQKEIIENNIARMNRAPQEKISFTAYNRHAEMNAYMDQLAADYPNLVKVVSSGFTPNSRELKYIKISTTNFEDERKPIIVADGGIHAREWIAPSVSLYMIRKLVENITETDVVNNIDWIIFPLINPDGYEHSHNPTSRLWRKTRSVNIGSTCIGVDGNRNFDFHWMESGSSNNPCSEIFAGPVAFSEMETRALKDSIEEYGDRVKAYLAVHSYGSYVLYPYGYDGSDAPNVEELHSLGVEIAEVIDNASAPGSKKYLVGNSGLLLNYFAAGASDDWARGVPDIELAYTIELPGGGIYGFDLPPSRIAQVVQESWEGILVLARYVIKTN